MGDRHPTFAELRRTRRLRLQLETARRAGERTVHEKLFDLSSGGFCFLTAQQFSPRDSVELKLISADHAFDIPVRAEVVHVRPSRQPGLKRVGCRFLADTPVRKLLLSSLHVLSQSRHPPRLEVGVDAVWSGPGGSSTGALYLANLGLDGALVQGVGLPPVGGPLIVGIYPPDTGEMVALPARVLWAAPAGEGTVAGLGFALESYTRAAVASYLESLLFTPFAPPPSAPECPPGTRIGGFVVGQLIERRRGHDYYRAEALQPDVDSRGDKSVVLRRFTGSGRDVDLWSDRFLDAMLIGSGLEQQPQVLDVFGATRERDAAWLATESFPSTPFDRILAQQDRRGPAAPIEAVLAVIEQALLGLAHCHALGQVEGGAAIVHGDLRPSQLLVGDDGEVKIAGFGDDPGGLGPGDMRAPPDCLPWLPPEAFGTGGARAPSADVYQVGVVLYEALTGALPFDALSPPELERQAAAGPVPPSQLNAAVGPELDKVVLAALAPDPSSRPPDARALLEALQAALPRKTEELPADAAPVSEVLQKVVTRSGNHPAYTPPAPEQIAAAARAQLESEERQRVRKRGLAAGEMLGRYEILENIARGGMAEVYRARVSGGVGAAEVVLKTVFQEDLADVGNVKLFLNEARVAALLSHPNIVQLTDYGFDRGRPYIAMEYVRGVTLGELVTVLASRGQRVPPPLAARIVADACAGIAYAHGATDDQGRPLELVHRDVSARNILLGFSGAVKLLDFGIAKFRGSSETTSSGRVRGTSAYLAPEQIREEKITRAVDIWALGINLYRLLTGTLPFERDTLALSITAVLQQQPLPAHEIAPGVPLELSLAAKRALEKDPSQRYANAAELRADLEKYLAGKPGSTADLKALLELTFPPGPTGQRRPSTADLTPFKPGAPAPPAAPLARAVALMEPLGAGVPAATGKLPVSRAPTPPVPRAPAALAEKAPVPPGLTARPTANQAEDDFDIAVTEEPVAEGWGDVTRPEPRTIPNAFSDDLGPEETTAVNPVDPRLVFGLEPTDEVRLDQPGARRVRKGPLGLVAKPPAPAAKKPDPGTAAEERFPTGPAPIDELADLFLDEAQPAGAPGDPAVATTAPVASPFLTNPAQLASPQQFESAATEQVPAYRPAGLSVPGPAVAAAAAGPGAAPLAQPPAEPPGAVPADALGWMRLWCEQPDTHLIIPGEAPVPRIWVARLKLDGYLAGKPDDTSWAGFDAWARPRLAPGETRWLGDALLAADPERDHLTAIASLLALIREHAQGG